MTDDIGLRDTETTTVTATSGHQLQLTLHVRDARVQPAIALAAATDARLYESDGTTPVPIGTSGSNVITIAAGGELTRTVTVQTVSEQLHITVGEPSADGVHPGMQTIALSDSRSQAVELTFHLSSTAWSGRVFDTRGRPAPVDVGAAREQVDAPYGFDGGRDLTTTPTGQLHRLTADVGGHFYFPVRAGDGDARFFLDTTRDTLTQTYTATGLEDDLAEGELLRRDIVVGLWSGGEDCDDISHIAVTPDVDYARDIQPIWDQSCIGCHAPGATNTGGLELNGNSLSRMLRVESRQVPGLLMIEPGRPQRSYLFEKVNCASPQHGTRMRPTDAMPTAGQALIRDFIAQLGGETTPDGGASGASAAGGASGAPAAGGDGAKKSSGCQVAPAGNTQFGWMLAAPLLSLVSMRLRRRQQS